MDRTPRQKKFKRHPELCDHDVKENEVQEGTLESQELVDHELFEYYMEHYSESSSEEEDEDENGQGDSASESDRENMPPEIHSPKMHPAPHLNAMEYSMLMDSDEQFRNPLQALQNLACSTPMVNNRHDIKKDHVRNENKKGHHDTMKEMNMKNERKMSQNVACNIVVEKEEIEEDGLLNDRIVKKMSAQQAKRKKQEARRLKIASKVESVGIRNLKKPAKNTNAASALELLVAEQLKAKEKDSPWKLFCLFLAVHLDALPTWQARSLTLKFHQLLHDAECQTELTHTGRTPTVQCNCNKNHRTTHQ